ncbi:hypothetical protein [Microbulbifer litoralis]|uniref:hypothetical protein n=1 Tax=Microbulbifer litoralis TaxID=2933965 RepID=UPI0020290F72|nr:hypothetical protein [Microbulbifer sp. GX H0434]
MSSSFKIRYNASSRIVRVLFLGPAGMETQLRAGRHLVERFRHHGRLKILVDSRHADVSLSAREQEVLAGFVQEQPVLLRARLAVLYPDGVNAVVSLVERLARAGQDARFFASEAAAVEWLNSREPVS